MVVEFTNTCAIVSCHHLSCEFQPHSWRGVPDKTICDQVCQWLPTDLWISLGSPISAMYKSSNWNSFESGVKHLTSNGQMMDQKYVVYNIKHLCVIMWHIFTSTNNTTILFPHNSGHCYTHIMSFNNVLKQKQHHFQILY